MDGENNGKPYEHGWFGGTTIFGNIHIVVQELIGLCFFTCQYLLHMILL